jgi:hypothetical protein
MEGNPNPAPTKRPRRGGGASALKPPDHCASNATTKRKKVASALESPDLSNATTKRKKVAGGRSLKRAADNTDAPMKQIRGTAKRPADDHSTKPPKVPQALKESRTTVSLSLRKCLVSTGDKANAEVNAIDEMVAATTWAAQRTMMFANLLVLKRLENGREPCALDRDFFFRCFQYSCQAKVNGERTKKPVDYLPGELWRAKRRKVNERRKELGEPPLESPRDDAIFTQEELDENELQLACDRADERKKNREQEQHDLKQCMADFDQVRTQGEFDKTAMWRPNPVQAVLTKSGEPKAGAFVNPGVSDHIEALIHGEIISNATTYIATSFVARRRLYLEDSISCFFKTSSHRARVVTVLLQHLDTNVRLHPESTIDWKPVFSRIRTAELVKSFRVELEDALKNGLIPKCSELLTQLGNAPPATPVNLKAEPHKFLRQMHVIQKARDLVLSGIQQADAENAEESDALEDEVEQADAALDYQDRVKYRSVFSLLPNRSGQSVFIFITTKSAASMKALDMDSLDSWYDKIFDFSKALGRGKLANVIPKSFRTDGVQLKVSLKRPGSTSDLMVKRGFGSLRGRCTAEIESTRRGIFELQETLAQSIETLEERGVVGLDPGRKDVYSSVMNQTERLHDLSNHKPHSHHLSNEQWSQLQRTRMIRAKDRKWRRVTGVARPSSGRASVLGALSIYSLRVGDYDALLASVGYRLSEAQILADYQTRRNRRVFRFSRLLATKSATARVCNSIMHHTEVLPRVPSGTRRKGRLSGRLRRPNPIVVFGGGQYASGGGGLASVPRKALIRELGHKTVVVIADEYKTSQMCCKCGTKLIDPDLRCSIGGCRIGEKRRFAAPDSRRLRQCPSEACLQSESHDDDSSKVFARHWNRDTNAAINILQVGMRWWDQGVRPDALRRSTPTALANADSPPSEELLEDINLLSEQ